MERRGLRARLAEALIRWGAALQRDRAPESLPALPPGPVAADPAGADRRQQAQSAKLPGVRAPLSIEKAVLNRDLAVLKREASDALAALGAAHAVVTSARLAQIQTLRSEVDQGEAPEDDLVDLAGDYQARQTDPVRLFDPLALVPGMPVPEGRAFDQIEESMGDAARAHLSALAAEYQRRLLTEQFEGGEKEA